MRGALLVLCSLVAGLACGAPRDAAAEAWQEAPATHEQVATALERLASRELGEAAWGAYLAATTRVPEAVPLLVARLREQAALPRAQRSFGLQAALLDALVVLDADVDANDLLPHAYGFLLPAVVVWLARHPDRHAAPCLSLFESLEPGSRAWRALGNMLAASRAGGFAASLLRGLDVRLVVRVWTGIPPRFRSPQGYVPGCGYERARLEGFPPLVVHHLSDEGEDDERLADGPQPVYSVRCERDDGILWHCTSLQRGVPPHAARLEWLEAFRARPEGLVERTELDLRWTGEQPYVREVARRRDALASAWDKSVRKLAALGLVTASDRLPVFPRVVVEADDRRTGSGKGDLPVIPLRHRRPQTKTPRASEGLPRRR